MSTTEKPLRFAAFRRVSTERQADRGESLRTQTTNLERDVKELGGVIVAWYGGQEHATEGNRKEEFNRLLADAQSEPKKFDAVIVARHDRWSRDNVDSEQGLRVIRDNGIKFFVGKTEQDLLNPRAFFLSLCSPIWANWTLVIETRLQSRTGPNAHSAGYGRQGRNLTGGNSFVLLIGRTDAGKSSQKSSALFRTAPSGIWRVNPFQTSPANTT